MIPVDKMDSHVSECQELRKAREEDGKTLQIVLVDPKISPNTGDLSFKVRVCCVCGCV